MTELALKPERNPAENFGTWGGHTWQDWYPAQPLEWADSEIRGYNADIQKDPDNEELIRKRDTLYKWRNAYLGEYNSWAPVRPVDPDLEKKFGELLLAKIDEVYHGREEERVRASRLYDGFKESRKRAIDFKNLPSEESGIVGDRGL